MLPKVSVVIANWNRHILLAECIRSIYMQNYENIEIIVVDNQSTDISVSFIHSLYPDVKIIVESVDLGACAAINTGCLSACGRYVMIMDNDSSFMRPGLLGQAVAILESCPIVTISGRPYHVGAIAGRIWGPSNPEGKYDTSRHFNWVFCGAGILVRKYYGDMVGWYDPDFFIYCNEMDFGAKLEHAGVVIEHNPNFDILHSHDVSCRPASRNVTYHEKNFFTVCIRHLPWRYAVYHILRRIDGIRYAPISETVPRIKGLVAGVCRIQKTIRERNPISNPWMISAFDSYHRGESIPVEEQDYHPILPIVSPKTKHSG